MNLLRNNILFLLIAISFFWACQENQETEQLPVLGHKHVANGDTVYHKIPDFKFVNQDSQIVRPETFEDKAYIADFFFTSCPTICPKVKQQMLRIYRHFENEDDLLFLSHSIDTRRDSVPRLKQYAEKLGINSKRWHLVTGDRDEIYQIADDYFSVATEDPKAPGGFDHSGRLILVDPNRHVRSFCDGTDPDDVDQFIKDIEILLDEMHS